MFTRIGQSNIGLGVEAVIPLPTVENDRLDLLAYDGNFISMTAVQPQPTRSRPRVVLGRGYKQFVSVAPRLDQARIIAYNPAAGAEQLISFRGVPIGDMHVTSGSPSPLPNLTSASTHLISGITPQGTFSWPFVVAYDAHTGGTSAYVWGWTPGAHRWIAANTTRLPAGITSMTTLEVGLHAYLAVVIGRRLEIHVIKVTDVPGGLTFSFSQIRAFDDWTPHRGVQLHSLDDGQHRRTIVAYDPASGALAADTLGVNGIGERAHIPGNATITRVATHAWPARSLVRTMDRRLVRYGPDDGVAEVWKI